MIITSEILFIEPCGLILNLTLNYEIEIERAKKNAQVVPIPPNK